MKNKLNYLTQGFLSFLILTGLISCKRMVDSPEGTANIYIAAAANALFPIPGNPQNYIADKAGKKLHVPIYLFRSGLQTQKTYSVSVSADDQAAQKLIDDEVVDKNRTIVAPADVYALPSSVSGGEEPGSFEVVFDASKLNAYLGKMLILSVHISSPSAYQINEKLSTLNILVDVDPIILGTKVEVTDKYIKNSGHPFKASVYDGSRRGVLADWTTNEAVKNFSDGTLGGFDNYVDGGFMSMERYGSPEIPNGKIYQTIKLPAGKYELTAAFLDFGVKERAFIIAARGNTLPDVTDLDKAIGYTPFTAPKLEFSLADEELVSIGVFANLIQDQQYFRLDKFRLFHYQGLWD